MPIYDAQLEVVCDVCEHQEFIPMAVGYSDHSGNNPGYSVTLTVERMESDGWEVCDDEEKCVCPDCVEERAE